MSRMENLTVVEEEMFRFLRNNVYESAAKLKPGLHQLLQNIKQFEKNRYETRVFSYLDIISWVESKVYDKPMSEVVFEKYLNYISRTFIREHSMTKWQANVIDKYAKIIEWTFMIIAIARRFIYVQSISELIVIQRLSVFHFVC